MQLYTAKPHTNQVELKNVSVLFKNQFEREAFFHC